MGGRRLAMWGACMALFMAALSSTACSQRPLDTQEKIVRATLRVLASDGQDVCVDRRTRGAPLAVFRAMDGAPPASRRPLAWRAPQPLRPPAGLSGKELFRDQIQDQRTYLRQPDVGPEALSYNEQRSLDLAARRLSLALPAPSTVVESGSVPGTTTRWWLFNKFAPGCVPNFTLSNPVWDAGVGFVTASADHWATTYAIQPRGNDWVATAQWSVWLY